jgi:hypothetical protein
MECDDLNAGGPQTLRDDFSVTARPGPAFKGGMNLRLPPRILASFAAPFLALLAPFVLAALAPQDDRPKPPPSDVQQKNLAQLQSDLAVIKQGSAVTPAQKQALAKSLQSAAQSATRPSAEAVAALSASLAAALADGTLSKKEQAQLAAAIGTVLNSAGISSEETQAVIGRAQALLQGAGVTRAEATAVGNDLRVIAAELRRNAAAAKAGAAAKRPPPSR